MKITLPILAIVVLNGCATPQMNDLKSTAPNKSFIVMAPLDCLYDKGVEHVSSYSGMSEPRFSWWANADRSYGWFRQPLSLVELVRDSEISTKITRSQTASAAAFGQGNDLIAFLSANPCRQQE